jgi:flagellar motility protein MotE (MotC chaperone)
VKRGRLLRHLRLIPSVLVLGTILLGIKGAGLVIEARAQDQAPQSDATQPQQPAANADPAADDADSSSAQVDVLTSLAKRRSELDARERDLNMRENLIAAAEGRVDEKIANLKLLQTQIQGLLVQRDDAEQKQIASLVKTYSNMPPKDAARIFDGLDEGVLLEVAQLMKPADLAGVLAKMQSEPAQKLTVKLAERLKISGIQPVVVPPPAQLASTLPPQPGAAPTAVPPPQSIAPTPSAASESDAPAPTPPAPQASKAPTPPPAAAGK